MKTKVLITATVEHIIEHEVGEDVTKRFVDIYLHGEGEHGYMDKKDLGGNSLIEVLEIVEE